MDPLTALAAIKGGIAAGRQIHQMSKEIAGFFDASDNAKKAHAKKKNSVFSGSASEEALATWTAAQNAKTAEAELREFIVNTAGFTAYQELLKIRREVIQQRKEAERQAAKDAEERQELMLTVFIILMLVAMVCGGLGLWLYSEGYLP